MPRTAAAKSCQTPMSRPEVRGGRIEPGTDARPLGERRGGAERAERVLRCSSCPPRFECGQRLSFHAPLTSVGVAQRALPGRHPRRCCPTGSGHEVVVLVDERVSGQRDATYDRNQGARWRLPARPMSPGCPPRSTGSSHLSVGPSVATASELAPEGGGCRTLRRRRLARQRTWLGSAPIRCSTATSTPGAIGQDASEECQAPDRCMRLRGSSLTPCNSDNAHSPSLSALSAHPPGRTLRTPPLRPASRADNRDAASDRPTDR
jgi:hypothetical protein